MMENEMGKNMGNEMEAGVVKGHCRDSSIQIISTSRFSIYNMLFESLGPVKFII